MTPRITANPKPDSMEKLVKLVPIALVVLVVLGIAGYFLVPKMLGTTPVPATPGLTPAEQAPAGTVATPATPAVVEPEVPPPPALLDLPVDQLIANARAALGDQRLVAPAGNNALEMYLAVLTKEPQNNTARDALMELTGFAREAAEREITTNNVEEAARMIALLERADPDSYTVQSLKKKLELKQLQIDRDKLQADTAQQAAQQASQQAAAERATAEREAAAAAAAASAPPVTDPGTSAPATSAPTTSAPATTGASTTAARPTSPASTGSSPASARPQPTTPATTAAPPPTSTSSGPSVEATVVQQFPPEYPAQAVRKRVEGWVEIEFTVGTNGKVKDAVVLRAQPTRVFDREAIRAIERWTFKPRMENGKAVETRLKRRMEFKLNS